MDIKTKVKVLLNQNLSPEELNQLKTIITRQEQVALTEAKTKDGKVLTYEGELAQGVAISLVTEAGSSPAPDGEYEMEDGTKVSVAAGVVSGIEKPEMQAPEAPMPPEMVQQMETKFSAQIKEVENAYEAKVTALNKTIAELTSDVKFTANLLQKLVETPIETIALSKQEQKKWEDMTPVERYNATHPLPDTK